MPEGCSILLLHGEEDKIIPFKCSRQIYEIAGNPKKLILYAEGGHNLDETAPEVLSDVQSWLIGERGDETA